LKRRLLAFICVLSFCLLGSTGVGLLPISCSSSESNPSSPTPANYRTYTTNFPIAENPISQGGVWMNGKTDGVDWSDVRTAAGLAFGTQVPPSGPPYNDSVALLKGTWGPDQIVTATVKSVNQLSTTFEEVELWLRGSISQHVATGYEINFRCLGGGATYVQIHYWSGPLNKYGDIASTTGPGLRNGDVVSARVVGNAFTVWINGAQVLQGSDKMNRYTKGSPGMGFYYQGSEGSDFDYGFTSFTATDKV